MHALLSSESFSRASEGTEYTVDIARRLRLGTRWETGLRIEFDFVVRHDGSRLTSPPIAGAEPLARSEHPSDNCRCHLRTLAFSRLFVSGPVNCLHATCILTAMDKDNRDDFTFAKLSDLKMPVTFRMYISYALVSTRPAQENYATDPSWKGYVSHTLSQRYWRSPSCAFMEFSKPSEHPSLFLCVCFSQ